MADTKCDNCHMPGRSACSRTVWTCMLGIAWKQKRDARAHSDYAESFKIMQADHALGTKGRKHSRRTYKAIERFAMETRARFFCTAYIPYVHFNNEVAYGVTRCWNILLCSLHVQIFWKTGFRSEIIRCDTPTDSNSRIISCAMFSLATSNHFWFAISSAHVLEV
jgi:hypothetical protein